MCDICGICEYNTYWQIISISFYVLFIFAQLYSENEIKLDDDGELPTLFALPSS